MNLITFPYPAQRVVRILSDNVGAVTNTIPDAQPVQYYPSGQAHIDVPWTLHNMTLLSQIMQPAVRVSQGATDPITTSSVSLSS